MKFLKLSLLAGVALLVSGCPHNEFVLTLTPAGDAIKRELVFYRVDRSDTNKPAYEPFPTNEYAAILHAYPHGTVSLDGDRNVATTHFRGPLPDDIGGAGTYTNLTTTMGGAGFYVERFRGDADFATRTDDRMRAADELVALLLGWSRAELGNEDHYPDLQRFLDVDVRRDLKNVSLYWWMGGVASAYKPGAEEEFAVRFCQFAAERGYFSPGDIPSFFARFQKDGDEAVFQLVRKLIAGKLQLPDSGTMPRALMDASNCIASWERFLAGTDRYRAKVRQWEKDRAQQPDLKKPEPEEVADDVLKPLLQSGGPGADDHLVVVLRLATAPLHTNGQWDEAGKKVRWESQLEPRGNTVGLPAFCYATWVEPDESFQKSHLGRVAIRQADLLEYCLWRAGLPAKDGAEWDEFLESARPGAGLVRKLETFRFAAESQSAAINLATVSSAFGRELLAKAVRQETDGGSH